MEYWIAYKFIDGKKLYISVCNRSKTVHTENIEEAVKFYDYDAAMPYFARGYTLQKKLDMGDNPMI